MIDLSVLGLGILQIQGSLYLPVLLIAVIFAILRVFKEPLYFWVVLVTVLGWAGTRMADCDNSGCGIVGYLLIASVTSEQMAVTRIAVVMGLIDFTLALVLLKFAWELPLARLIIALYACMIPFYALAAMGIISGGAALGFVNLLGFAKLFAIIGGASGGAKLVYDRRRRIPGLSRASPVLDTLAGWLGTEADLARASEAARHQR